jgi:hypothetical protein
MLFLFSFALLGIVFVLSLSLAEINPFRAESLPMLSQIELETYPTEPEPEVYRLPLAA